MDPVTIAAVVGALATSFWGWRRVLGDLDHRDKLIRERFRARERMRALEVRRVLPLPPDAADGTDPHGGDDHA